MDDNTASPLENDKLAPQKGHGTTTASWFKVSSAEPCPICGEQHQCWRARDRRVVCCRRREANRTVPGWRFDKVCKEKRGQFYARWRIVENAADIETLDFAYQTLLYHLSL